MAWAVETLNEVVDAELKKLPKDLQAAFLRLSERIEAVGLERISTPHLAHLRGKLWEMRLQGSTGIARAIYFAAPGRRVVVVHVFVKKTEKTPRAALELAGLRMREYEK